MYIVNNVLHCYCISYIPLQLSLPFPTEGLVYDYRLDDGGISHTGKSEDDEEDDKKSSFKVLYMLTLHVHL